MDIKAVGKFIACLRREKNLTQQQLADVLNISNKTVSKWENGRGLPDATLLIPLCEILEVSVNELLSGERLAVSDFTIKADSILVDSITSANKRLMQVRISRIVAVLIAVLSIFYFVCYQSWENSSDNDKRWGISHKYFHVIEEGGDVTLINMHADTYKATDHKHYWIENTPDYIYCDDELLLTERIYTLSMQLPKSAETDVIFKMEDYFAGLEPSYDIKAELDVANENRDYYEIVYNTQIVAQNQNYCFCHRFLERLYTSPQNSSFAVKNELELYVFDTKTGKPINYADCFISDEKQTAITIFNNIDFDNPPTNTIESVIAHYSEPESEINYLRSIEKYGEVYQLAIEEFSYQDIEYSSREMEIIIDLSMHYENNNDLPILVEIHLPIEKIGEILKEEFVFEW